MRVDDVDSLEKMVAEPGARAPSPYLSLKRRDPDARAKEIVAQLQDAILNPGRGDGSTGLNYGDWLKLAHAEICQAIREAEASVAFREQISSRRIGGICVRVGFMLLAAVASFAAFWYGIVDIWSRIGPAWGVIAAMTALALAFGFIVAGLYYGNDGADDEAERARQRYGLD